MVQAALLATAITSAFLEGAGVAALGTTLAALALILVLRAVVAWAQEWVARYCSAAVKSALRMQLLRRASVPESGRAESSPGGAGSGRSGEIATLATRGLDALDLYFARYLPQLVLSAIVPVAVVVCLAFADALAAATVALTVPLIPLFMVLIGSATERRRTRRWTALTRLSSHFLDVVAGLPTLRVFGRAGAQLSRLEAVTDEYRRESLATLRVAFLSAFALELAATLSVALVAVEVGLRLVDGSLDLRTGLFVLVLAPEAYLPLRQLGASFHASEEGLGAADAAFAIIESAPQVMGGHEPVPSLPAAEIRVEGVTVRQPGRSLEAPWRASAVVRPGEVVALTGASGAGKSTLLEIILGLRRPDEGSVAVATGESSVAVADLDRAEWHRHVAWAPQHPYCFPATVTENVRLGQPGASDEEVSEVLAAVGLADLDPRTRLGEGGAGISSGQRRRLGVARALLRRSDLLLLDEPTAGLDADSETAVLRAIRAAARDGGRAVLLVAHRPAALAVADRVVAIVARSGERA